MFAAVRSCCGFGSNLEERQRRSPPSFRLETPGPGTFPVTSVSLRRAAKEFRRLAMASSDPAVIAELEFLVWKYLERALEAEASEPPPQRGRLAAGGRAKPVSP